MTDAREVLLNFSSPGVSLIGPIAVGGCKVTEFDLHHSLLRDNACKVPSLAYLYADEKVSQSKVTLYYVEQHPISRIIGRRRMRIPQAANAPGPALGSAEGQISVARECPAPHRPVGRLPMLVGSRPLRTAS